MIITFIFLLLVLALMPWLAIASHRQFQDEKEFPESRYPIYAQLMIVQLAITGIAYWAATANDLYIPLLSTLSGTALLFSAGLYAAGVLILFVLYRIYPPEDSVAWRFLFPKTSGEQAAWVGTVTLSSACEEFIYRGVLFLLIAQFFGNWWIAAFVASFVFGLGHYAQGLKGAIVSGTFALGLHALVVISGGLGLAITVHVAYNFTAEWLMRRSHSVQVPDQNF
jgi:membrane protease YdiL (CAAX protease family)